jgi:kinesin family protein 2/24
LHQKHEFALDRVYGENTQTESLYQEAAQDLVPWIWAGGIGTLFAYGQTGSGKTFTVTGITNLVARDMFAMDAVDNRELHVCCFEILGKKAYGTVIPFPSFLLVLNSPDLLDNRRVFSIMEDSFGAMQLVGAHEQRPTSEAAFLSLIKTSALLRTSAPTAKNDQSSRSHAIYRIRIVNPSTPSVPCGELYLVDLAGSEGSADSASHSAARLAETKDINSSLSILKDCIRGRTLWALQPEKATVHIPWRASKLTQVLKHVFNTTGERACKTIVVACVAPSIVDSAHSKNTLRYAEMLKVPVPKRKKGVDAMAPSTWTNTLVKEWIAHNVCTPCRDPTPPTN